MERTYIAQALTMAGQTVKVQGFVENNRNGKSMAFIVLKDITGKMQITVEKEKHPDLCPALDQLTGDSVITVVGQVNANEYVKLNGVELIPDSIADRKASPIRCPSSGRKFPPRRSIRRWSAPASTSASTTAGSTCAPTRTS